MAMQGDGSERPPDWVRQLTRPVLAQHFGPSMLGRGAGYQSSHAVRDLAIGPDATAITATVHGRRPYTTRVMLGSFGSGTPAGGRPSLEVLTECNCPIGGNCQHVVAVILEAQAQADAAGGTANGQPGPARWESLLAPVISAPEPVGRATADTIPLGLLIEVVAGSRSRYMRKDAHLQLRPLVPGASGGWIRTGISWTDLHSPSPWRRWNPTHSQALGAILAAERARAHSYYSTAQWITLDGLGSGAWDLLEDVAAAGLALVTGGRAQQPVRLAAQPAALVIDATREASGDIVLRTSLRVPGAGGRPTPIGNPPRGVFLASPQGLLLARLAQPLSAPLAALLDTPDSVTVPARDADRFLARYYPVLRQRAHVQSGDASVEFPTIEPPRLALEVTFDDGHRTRLQWAFRYRVGEAPIDVPLRPDDDPGSPVARDPAAEESLLASLEVLDAVPGLRVDVLGKSRPGVVVEPQLQGWPTVAFVRDVLPALQAREDIDVTLRGAPLDYTEVTGPPVVAVSATDASATGSETGSGSGSELVEDWFDLGIDVTVGGEHVPLATLLTALAHGEQQLILDSGTWFALDAPELQALRRIVAEARALSDHESDQLRINRYQAGLWEELVELGIVAHQSDRWQRSVGALLALSELPRPQPPESLQATLRHYQLDGYQWLSFLVDQQLGGILADDMGLGKTLQTLAMIERARAAGTLTPQAPVLVVAPTSVVGAWQREAARFTPELAVVPIVQTVAKSGAALTKTIAGAHVVVTSYALFRIDADQYTSRAWAALVLDEAQAVKNHQSRTYQVARTLPAPTKLAITGTPLENSLMDLWSLLSIVAPGLFPNPQKFAETYRRPIESGQSPQMLTALRRRIRPLMLRRTKEAVAGDLPPKIEQVVAVPLNPAHRRYYDRHLARERQRILGLLDDVDRNRIAILTALTKLRQLSLDVHLVEPDAPASIGSSKIDALLEQLVEVVAEGHRCLVFSQFTRYLQVVRDRLAAAGIEYVYLDGRTRNRPKRIAEFTDGHAPVFLISLKAGGSGLTLTQADYVFVLDPWWNPAVEAQAVDRTHRIGQDKTVMVYRLVSEGTIEEKVVALQERKRELFSRVVDEGGLMGAPLTADDIRGLLDA